MSRRSRLVPWSVLVLALLVAAPPALADSDSLAERSDSRFELLPGQEIVRVKVELTLTSLQPDRVTIGPCPSNPGLRCRLTTRYYTNQWGYVWVPGTATDLAFRGTSATMEENTGGWRNYLLSFPPLYYRQTRRITVTYDLPNGKPRSANPVRVTDAYAHFCWHGQATDTGTVTALLPKGYEQASYGDKVKVKHTGSGLELRAASTRNPGEFFACTDAFDEQRLITTTTVSPSGRDIVVEAWPEDPDWSTAMTRAVARMVPELETHIGLPIPGDGEVVVREVARQALRGYAGEFISDTDLIRINERYDDQGLLAHELAHAWFNEDISRAEWITEGFVGYLEQAVQNGECLRTSPTDGSKPLTAWTYLPLRPTDAQEARVDYQYDGACSIHQRIADVIGEDGMRDVMNVLLTDGRAYGWTPPGEVAEPDASPTASPDAGASPIVAASPAPEGTPVVGSQVPSEIVPEVLAPRVGRAKPADWKEWLDVVEEVGLLPAGAADPELAERLLLDWGIAKPKDLKGRDEARAAYHVLLSVLDGRQAPFVVRDLLDRWRFGDAGTAIDAATDVAGTLLASTTTMTAEDAEAAWSAYAAARSVKALRALGG